MKEKKPLTAEELYKKNLKKSRWLHNLALPTFYTCLLIAAIFAFFALKNSIGNVFEILDALDKEKYTGAEIQANYARLVATWGEWEIVGENNAGLVIRYINIKNAIFSALAITQAICAITFFVAGIIFGRLVLPGLSKKYEDGNKELVDLTSLRAAEQTDKIYKSKKEWF